MENSIKDIINGIHTFITFEKVVVEKCTYINRDEEKIEILPTFNQATATLGCGGGHYHFDVLDRKFSLLVPFAIFNVNAQFFYRQESFGEMAHINLSRGNEIQMSRPLVAPYPINDNCKITLFGISRQHGKLIAFLLLTPDSNDDYYFRVKFEE